jgi:predicted alpha/beta-hydrolase family hydrolase
MSKWTYQTLYMEISRRGWRTKEPFSARPETSQVWQKVFADLRRDGLGFQGLADKLLVPAEELLKLVFGLVTVGMPVAASGGNGQPRNGHLRLVT